MHYFCNERCRWLVGRTIHSAVKDNLPREWSASAPKSSGVQVDGALDLPAASLLNGETTHERSSTTREPQTHEKARKSTETIYSSFFQFEALQKNSSIPRRAKKFSRILSLDEDVGSAIEIHTYITRMLGCFHNLCFIAVLRLTSQISLTTTLKHMKHCH